MNLIYRRRLCKSQKNRASVIAIPRSIAQSWEKYSSIELAFYGDRLIIKPIVDDRA